MDAMASGDKPLGFGGFLLDDMELALPLTALREVQPCSQLCPLPCREAAVIGGLNLRGVVVPVLDLRVLLGKAAHPLQQPCVVIMVHDGHVLGLLSTGVSGVFEALSDHIKPMASLEGTAALCQGTVVRADSGASVGLISPKALFDTPGVPRTLDPEPERCDVIEHQSSIDDGAQGCLPVMLMRCGKVALSIDAMVVSATLLSPHVQESPLAMGHCRGVIEHAGMLLPALDFQALLGLGPGQPQDLNQAFVMNTPEGAVAFLISEVMDVVRCHESDFLAVPRFALPHPTLFCGTLPREALADEIVQRSRAAITQFLRVNGCVLQQHEEVRNLASTVHQPGSGQRLHPADVRSFVASTQVAHQGRAVLTFMLGGETAAPLEQIQEILPYSRDISIFDTRGSLLGVLVNRGRSIPVMCLSGLVGLPAPEASPAVSVLVVDLDGTLIGFAVPMLKSIETTHWEPALTQESNLTAGSLAAALRSKALVKVGDEQQSRMLPLIDLSSVARALQSAEEDCPCV